MEKRDLPLPGAFLVLPRVRRDGRGSFVKTFQADEFARFGVAPVFREQFHSLSARGVVRGMHFQRPPRHHDKLVCCLRGRALDVLLDLRRSSPTFGRHAAVRLSAEEGHALYVPAGLAHGFRAEEDDTLMLYQTTSEHSPEHDDGVRWDGFGFDWGAERSVVSERDGRFPALAGFDSPFA